MFLPTKDGNFSSIHGGVKREIKKNKVKSFVKVVSALTNVQSLYYYCQF